MRVATASALVLVVSLFAGTARADDEAPSPSGPSPAPPASPPSAPAPVAREPRPEAEIAELRQRLDEQEARVRRLEVEARERKERTLVLSAFAQVDWVPWRQSSEDEVDAQREPLNENRFLLRRARIRAEAERGLVSGAVEVDVNTVKGPQVRPFDAEVSIRWPERHRRSEAWIQASAGLLLTPFGMEVQELERVRLFMERPTFAEALFPGAFDLGARVTGGYRFVSWAIGAMNGDPIGEKAFPGRDPNKSKDLVGRLGVAAPIGDVVKVRGGVSAVTGRGFHEGTQSTKDTLVWRDLNENGLVDGTEIQVIPGQASTPSEGFKRFAVGADLRVDYRVPILGAGAVFGEIVRGSNMDRGVLPADPVASGRDLRELGWEIGATQSITRWGAVGVRYDRYDPDADARDQAGVTQVPADRSQSTWAFAAALRDPHFVAFSPTRQAFGSRFVVEYDHVQNARGRSETGAPATLKDDRVTLRFEVSF